MNQLEQAFALRRRIRDAEENYFQVIREEEFSRAESSEEIENAQDEVIEEVQRKTVRKSFICSFCNKSMANKTSLTNHIRNVHAKERNFRCDYCSKSFYNKYYLKDHVILHSNPRYKNSMSDTTDSTRPFKCTVNNCSKYFRLNRQLRFHQRKVHEGEFIL